VNPIPAPATVTFEAAYGGALWDWGNSVEQTSDGGYIIGGLTESFGAGGFDFYLARIDSLGNLLWDTTYGAVSDDWGYCARQTTDGGYVMAGYTTLPTGHWDAYLVKTDSLGGVIWDETYGDSSLDEIYLWVMQTADGGYIGVGDRYGTLSEDVYLVKTDSSGNLEWDTTYGGDLGDVGCYIEQTFDSGYIIAGFTKSFGSGLGDIYLMKIDSDGNVRWDTTYGGSNDDMGFCVRQTPDGGYVVAGWTKSFGAGSNDAYLVRTDSLGKVLWEKTYGGIGKDVGTFVQQTADGGYVLTGYTNSFGAGNDDVYLVKTDSLGNMLWDTTYGGMAPDRGYSISQTSDGGYAITGYTGSLGAGVYDVYLLKTDESGHVGTQEQSPSASVQNPELLQNTPNPTRGSIAINYFLPFDCRVSLNICDAAGRVVERLADRRQEAGPHQIVWDAKRSPAGTYFCRLEAGGFVCVKKLLVVR
jgi:hypothetical protein